MNRTAMMSKIETILRESGAGVLTTVGEDGTPSSRWMTPAVLKGRPGALYAITSPHSRKVRELRQNPAAEWLLQVPSLNEVVTLRGRVNVVDNPSFKNEVLDAVARRLHVFWRINVERTDMVVLETVIEEAGYFVPMKAERATVSFQAEEES